jgi:flavin reductase (DIM6/NTAB) family NADH-FMN oxidoreductase RutF
MSGVAGPPFAGDGGSSAREPGPTADDATVVGPVPEGRDPLTYDKARRRVLWSIPTGLFVVGSRAHLDGMWRSNLMTASLVVQVAVTPKLVGVSIDRAAVTCRLVEAGGSFSLSFVAREDRALVRRFVKPVTDVVEDERGRVSALGGEAVIDAVSGSPILARAPAWLDCGVRHQIDLGSHVLFVGEVLDVGGAIASLGPGGADGDPDRPDASGSPGLPELPELLRMEDTRMSYGG